MILEIACFNLESALIAQDAGADRIELCENYSLGGITPDFKTIQLTRRKIWIDLNVMIRPVGENFVYTKEEFEEMKRAIWLCKQTDINGVVFGILNSNKSIDLARCSALVEFAKPMSTTFHRAFDQVTDPFQSLEDVMECGFRRILTSGQEENAIKGAAMISKLTERAKDRIIIMPGGGMRSGSIKVLAENTGAIEFHSSAITNASFEIANAEEIKSLKSALRELEK